MPELSNNTGHPSLIKTDRKGIVSDNDMWTLLKVHFLQGSRIIVADDPFPIHPNLAALSIKPQNSEIELHDQYSTNFYGLSLLLKLLIPAFRGASFPMHQGSKLRNWIAQLIFNQFLWTKFALKAMNQDLQTSPRTSKCGQKWVENSRCSPHPSLCIKAQNSEIELQDQYSTNFHDLSSSLKLSIRAFRRVQERPNVARNGYGLQSVHPSL